MGYNQFTQVVQRPDIFKPLPDELFLAQAKSVYDRADKTAQKVGSTYNNLFGISTYGKDAEVLNQFQQDFQSQVAEMSKHSLATPEANSKINSLISQYSSNPDVLAIHQRAASFTNEQRARKEAESKGLSYVSPILDQAEEYYNSGVYKKDTQFNQTGWVSPQIEKLKAEALKNVPKVTKNVKVGNYWVPMESYDADALKANLNEIYSRPDVQKDFAYRFDRSTRDKDWSVEGVVQLQDDLFKAQNALAINPNDIKAQAFISKYSPLLNNPGKLGENIKNRYKQDAINQMINEDIASAQYMSEGKMDADDFTLKAIDHQNRLIEDQAKDLSLGASANGWTLQETISDPAKRQKALADSQQLKLTEFSQKEGIKLQNKIAGKENAIKGGLKFTDSDTITYTDVKGDTKTLQYGTFKDEIKKADATTAKSMIAAALNKKNATDGSWIPLSSDQVTVTGVGDKRKIKINSTYGFGGESIPIDDVIDISNFIGTSKTEGTIKTSSQAPNRINAWGKDFDVQEVKGTKYVAPKTQEEYNNIPKGAHYYDTDGVVKTKK